MRPRAVREPLAEVLVCAECGWPIAVERCRECKRPLCPPCRKEAQVEDRCPDCRTAWLDDLYTALGIPAPKETP